MLRLMMCAAVAWPCLGATGLAQTDDSEDRAVAFVERLGGRVVRDEKVPGHPVTEVHLNGTTVDGIGLKNWPGSSASLRCSCTTRRSRTRE